MKLFCYIGLHSYLETRHSVYSSEFKKFVVISHIKECLVCGKKIEYV